MTPDLFNAVDRYLSDRLIAPDPVLEATIAATEAGGLPAIAVEPSLGKLLFILGRLVGAKRILEIGPLGGYSTIWLARSLTADGNLISLEFEPKHAEVARANIASAGFSERVEVIVGPAIEALPSLEGPFDLVFIDADKRSTPDYFDWALKLTRPGSLIVVDNVVRGGKVVEETDDLDVLGIQAFLSNVSGDARVTVTALQTVSSKGHDGFAIALIN